MFITALDIGSSKIKALAAEIKEDKLFLLGGVNAPSSGVRRGEIAELNDSVKAVKNVLGKIREIEKSAVKNIFVNVNGGQIKCQPSRGIVAVSRADNEISAEDVDRAVKASQAIKLTPNRMVLHNITREFTVDGVNDIRDPQGMSGTRLEIDSLIIDAFSPNVQNVIGAVESAGGEIGGLIYNPLAAAAAVLTKIQKDLGSVFIDIGFGTTNMSVYEEGKLIHAATFPVGSNNVTNDLAIGLKCSIRAAELIKIFFGAAQSGGISSKEKITADSFKEATGVDLKELDENFKSVPSRRFVSEIVEVRLAEIFELVNDELKLIGVAGNLPAGAVISGGGAKLPQLVDLAKRELKLPAEISHAAVENLCYNFDSDGRAEIDDPEMAVAAGLLLWGRDKCLKNGKWQWPEKFPKFSIKKFWRYFIP